VAGGRGSFVSFLLLRLSGGFLGVLAVPGRAVSVAVPF